MLMKEIKENTNKWKAFYANGLEDLILSTLLKVIYRFNTICIKIPMIFFAEIEKNPS